MQNTRDNWKKKIEICNEKTFYKSQNEKLSLELELFFFYFLLYTQEENIGIAKIFDFQIVMHLHVLGCLKYDFTIYT